jgi:hypothetical protein
VQSAKKRHHGIFSKKEEVEDWTKLDGNFKEGFQKIWVLSDKTELHKKCTELIEDSRFQQKIISKHKISIENQKDAIWPKGGELNYPKLIEALKSYVKDHNDTGNDGKDVLYEALNCATDVQQFTHQIKILKKGGKSGLPVEADWNNLNWNIKRNLQEICMSKGEPVEKERIDAGNTRRVKHDKPTVKFANNDGAKNVMEGHVKDDEISGTARGYNKAAEPIGASKGEGFLNVYHAVVQNPEIHKNVLNEMVADTSGSNKLAQGFVDINSAAMDPAAADAIAEQKVDEEIDAGAKYGQKPRV